METSSVGGAAVGSDEPAVTDSAPAPEWRSPRSRVDREREQLALACVRSDRRADALKILMSAYGAAITAFALRMLRDRELARDVRQQVFLEAFQGLDKFEGRDGSSLWSWLCKIAYHRCVDELRRQRRAGTVDDFDVWHELLGQPDAAMDAERAAKRRALEHCLGKLSAAVRAQLLMRYLLGLSHIEIGDAVGAAHGTVQVRMSRTLPRLRRCLRGEGVAR